MSNTEIIAAVLNDPANASTYFDVSESENMPHICAVFGNYPLDEAPFCEMFVHPEYGWVVLCWNEDMSCFQADDEIGNNDFLAIATFRERIAMMRSQYGDRI